MPSSADRKRLEVPAYLHERLVEIAIDEDRTVASVVQEVVTLGLSHYQPRPDDASPALSFTQAADRVLALAREEAVGFNHSYIGTEHLLLGLLQETDSVAARLLGGRGIGLDETLDELSYMLGRGVSRTTHRPQYAPRAQRVLRLAAEEAERFDSAAVGPEHLLLGLTEVQDGIAARFLARHGVLDAVRRDTLHYLLNDVTLGRESAEQAAPSPEQSR